MLEKSPSDCLTITTITTILIPMWVRSWLKMSSSTIYGPSVTTVDISLTTSALPPTESSRTSSQTMKRPGSGTPLDISALFQPMAEWAPDGLKPSQTGLEDGTSKEDSLWAPTDGDTTSSRTHLKSDILRRYPSF